MVGKDRLTGHGASDGDSDTSEDIGGDAVGDLLANT